MKTIKFSLIMLAVTALAACSTPSNVIKGVISDTPFESWNVEQRLIDGTQQSTDTLTLKSGKIEFEAKFDAPTIIYIDPVANVNTSMGITLVYEPEQKISFNAQMEERHIVNIEAIGSTVNEDYSRIHNEINKDYIAIVKLIDETNKLPENQREEQIKKINQLSARIHSKKVQFIKNNTDKEVSALLLNSLYSPEDMVACADLLSDNVRNSIFKPIFEQVEKKRKELATVKVGEVAPDFKLKTTAGKDLRLSDLRGKWVIIDFWGSWCSWCIKDFPAMKKFYAANKKRVEILGVNHNDTYDRWRAAVGQNGLTWINVHNPEANTDDNDPVVLYNVRGFPTKIVVDPEGKIFEIAVGYKEGYYDELMKRIK